MGNVNRIVYPSDDLRGKAVRDLLRRLGSVENNRFLPVPALDSAMAQDLLRRRGCLLEDGNKLCYAPSWAARQAVFEGVPGMAWSDKMLKKQKGAFRSAAGALFRLPVEGSGEVVEAFITDWSPFPAACAVAVHQLHPLAGGVAGDCFTGRFVRHPLVGDLLPVYVASWVRPDFGTGAVIVNPAHSAVDLKFARLVGLPVRFALVETHVSCDPTTWPAPPILKNGQTTRTGRFDNLDVGRATDLYFAELAEKGWATRVMDRAVGTSLLASGGVPSPLLQAVLAIDDSHPFELYWPAGEVETTLLFARLLFMDLHGRPLEPQAVRLFQRADVPAGADVSPELAGLAAGPLDQVGVVKPQTLDQCRIFAKSHDELAVGDPAAPAKRDFAAVKRDLLVGNYQAAFAGLYPLQKQAAKTDKLIPAAYFALAYVLAGLEAPADVDVAQAWMSMA